MEAIKEINLKQLVEECEIEFEREKPFRKSREEMLAMTQREMVEHFREKNMWMRP